MASENAIFLVFSDTNEEVDLVNAGETDVWYTTGMKASPRFREATAYIKLRHQPAQVKYPLLALHIAANPQAYDAAPLNVREDVRNAQLL